MTNQSSKPQFTVKNAVELRPKVTTVSALEVTYENMDSIIRLFGTAPRINGKDTFSAKRFKFRIGDMIVFNPKENEVKQIVSASDLAKSYDILKPKV